jgi:hypothetical protein
VSLDRISRSATLAPLLFAFVLAGCSAALSDREAQDVIREHFKERGFAVIVLEVGKITGTGLENKVYMGTPGFTVEITEIVLEDAGGRRLTFRGGAMRIREKPGEKGRWQISGMSGIPVL